MRYFVRNSLKNNQAGVVSIITVMLMTMILSLITIGFVKSTIQNQRESLDNQLSTQAFYAAETGVNDAARLLAANLTIFNAPGIMNSTDCNAFLGKMDEIQPDVNVLENTANIKYTCVLVKNTVDNIRTDLEAGGSSFYAMNGAGAIAIKKINVAWSDTPSSLTDTDLPNKTIWGSTPAMIKLTIFYPASYSRSDLINGQKSFYLKPVTSGGADINFTAYTDGYGGVIAVNCDHTGKKCQVEITNTPANFYIKLTSIYTSSSVEVTAYDGPDLVKLIGAQYSFDVTGRANDVYKRIEVRRGVEIANNPPNSVITSGADLCKQYEVWPGGYNDEITATCPALN